MIRLINGKLLIQTVAKSMVKWTQGGATYSRWQSWTERGRFRRSPTCRSTNSRPTCPKPKTQVQLVKKFLEPKEPNKNTEAENNWLGFVRILF